MNPNLFLKETFEKFNCFLYSKLNKTKGNKTTHNKIPGIQIRKI